MMRECRATGDEERSGNVRMAISTSSEHGELVLTSTRANIQEAITGLLNGIVAHSLPTRTESPPTGPHTCDRTTSVAAQATNLHAAVSELVDGLLEAIEIHDGGIRGVELHGVMTGRNRCTIWGQACLGEPGSYRSFQLLGIDIEEASGETSITVTLRSGN